MAESPTTETGTAEILEALAVRCDERAEAFDAVAAGWGPADSNQACGDAGIAAAFRSAAEKEGGVEAADYLATRAKRILDQEVLDRSRSQVIAPDTDPRPAPAVNAFGRELTGHGAQSSIRTIREAVIVAADATTKGDTK